MTIRTPNTIDADRPPEGVRLRVAAIAGQLGVSMTDMAEATAISRTAVFDIVTANKWPVRADNDQIKQAVEQLLRDRGASDEQLINAWSAQISLTRTRSDTNDRYGRPRSHVPKPSVRRTAPPEEEEKVTDVLLPKQTLSQAARRAFTLFANPFDGEVTDDEQMFANGEISYVREVCMDAATGGRFVAVVSESGGGKTTILEDLQARVQRDRKPVIFVRPSVVGMEDNDMRGKTLKSADILHAIITTLDPLQSVPQTLEARTKRVAKLLVSSAENGFHHLLVIEEAHCLPEATLKHLKRLHELRLGRKPLLGILLLAQPELALKLDPRRASLREVTQRCEVVHLLPLDGDLKKYLDHRARAAGRKLEDFIDDSGIEELRARLTVRRTTAAGKATATSLLYPLAVNNVMTAALNVAGELGAQLITKDIVRAI